MSGHAATHCPHTLPGPPHPALHSSCLTYPTHPTFPTIIYTPIHGWCTLPCSAYILVPTCLSMGATLRYYAYFPAMHYARVRYHTNAQLDSVVRTYLYCASLLSTHLPRLDSKNGFAYLRVALVLRGFCATLGNSLRYMPCRLRLATYAPFCAHRHPIRYRGAFAYVLAATRSGMDAPRDNVMPLPPHCNTGYGCYQRFSARACAAPRLPLLVAGRALARARTTRYRLRLWLLRIVALTLTCLLPLAPAAARRCILCCVRCHTHACARIPCCLLLAPRSSPAPSYLPSRPLRPPYPFSPRTRTARCAFISSTLPSLTIRHTSATCLPYPYLPIAVIPASSSSAFYLPTYCGTLYARWT